MVGRGLLEGGWGDGWVVCDTFSGANGLFIIAALPLLVAFLSVLLLDVHASRGGGLVLLVWRSA